MKYRHTLIFTGVCLPVCILLRILQLVFTIDDTTGFIKQPYSAVSLAITVVIFASIATLGVMAYFSDKTEKKAKDKNYFISVTSFILSGVFIYDTVALIGTMSVMVWYDALSVLLGIVCAVVFAAYGVRNIYQYKFLNILLIVPVFYYVIRLISIFVSTSALALVTENVYLIFTNASLLFFLFEFSKMKNNIDEKVKYKKLFASAIVSVALCLTQSVPKMVLQFSQISVRDKASALLNFAMALFVLSCVLSVFSDKPTQNGTHQAKHLAE